MPKKSSKTLREWCIENKREDLLEEWDYEKNGEWGYTPDNVASQSHKQVYWKCKKCGYSLPCRVQDKILGKTKCRICSNHIIIQGYNDFETWCKNNDKEYLLNEWDYQKNDALGITPKNISYGAKPRVWWICPKGHSYLQFIQGRSSEKYNCPYCSGHKVLQGFNDLETWCKDNNREFILDEWDYEKNNILPSEITARSDKNIWFICPLGHSYQCRLNTRTRPNELHGCSVCNKSNITSFPEQAILFYLEKIYTDTETSNRALLNGKELDIYIPSIKVAIEYDGEKWHKNPEKDILKNKMCIESGITLYRIREPECPILTDGNSVNIILSKRNNYEELEKVIHHLFDKLQINKSNINIKRDESKIRKKYIKSRVENSFKSYCKQHNRFDLLNEWDVKANFPLVPENFSFASRSSVWWKCSKCGHEWKAIIGNRIRMEYGCPECGKKRRNEKNSKKIKCIETEEIFSSLKDAGKIKHINIGHISECCKGTRKTAGGYHWEYADKENNQEKEEK